MQAWRIEKHGGLEVLERKQIADPVPGPMQVLVRVEAVGLNHLDLWVRKGVAGHKFPLPITPGCDIAGVIADFGPGAEQALAGAGRQAAQRGRPDRRQSRASLAAAAKLASEALILSAAITESSERHAMAAARIFIAVPVANVIARPENMSADGSRRSPDPLPHRLGHALRQSQAPARRNLPHPRGRQRRFGRRHPDGQNHRRHRHHDRGKPRESRQGPRARRGSRHPVQGKTFREELKTILSGIRQERLRGHRRSRRPRHFRRQHQSRWPGAEGSSLAARLRAPTSPSTSR